MYEDELAKLAVFADKAFKAWFKDPGNVELEKAYNLAAEKLNQASYSRMKQWQKPLKRKGVDQSSRCTGQQRF